MLYGKENLNSRFCPLTLLKGAEVQLSIQNALSLMLVYCVLLKGKTGHPFYSTSWYLFHQIPYISSPVFRPSYGMNKTIPDISGPCRSLVLIWLYSMHIMIWCLKKLCRFLSLLMLCNGPYFTLLFKWPVLFLKHVWMQHSSAGLNRGISLCVSILARACVYFSVLSSFDHIWGLC